MRTERTSLAQAPSLIVHPEAGPQGAVLFLHGLSARKEGNEAELRRFAERGLLAVGIDAPSHGARADGFLERLDAASEADRKTLFLELVRRSAAEVPDLLLAIADRYQLPSSVIGICGVSFGGFTTYASLSKPIRPAAAVALIAAPELAEPERFFPTPLLSITAEHDERVDTAATRRFHASLAPAYASAPERLQYVELPGEQHFMSAEAWDRALGLATGFLARFLSR